MALIKAISHPTGATAEYWRVLYVAVNYGNSFGTVSMGGYTSLQARQEGKPPLDGRSFAISPADFEQYFSTAVQDEIDSNPVKNSYLFIKGITGGEFSDAVDDLQLYIN